LYSHLLSRNIEIKAVGKRMSRRNTERIRQRKRIWEERDRNKKKKEVSRNG
jgi:hypothetical protein